MFFHRLLLLSIVPVSLARATFQKRDTATVVADIATLKERLTSLNDTVTSFNDGYDIDTILAIQDGALDVAYAITNTTQDVNDSDKFDQTDSETIAFAFLGDVSPLVFDLLKNLEAKKPVFDSGFFPVAPVLINDLRDEQAATDELGPALVKKLDPEFEEAVPNLIKEFDDAFNHTIAVYSQD